MPSSYQYLPLKNIYPFLCNLEEIRHPHYSQMAVSTLWSYRVGSVCVDSFGVKGHGPSVEVGGWGSREQQQQRQQDGRDRHGAYRMWAPVTAASAFKPKRSEGTTEYVMEEWGKKDTLEWRFMGVTWTIKINRIGDVREISFYLRISFESMNGT